MNHLLYQNSKGTNNKHAQDLTWPHAAKFVFVVFPVSLFGSSRLNMDPCDFGGEKILLMNPQVTPENDRIRVANGLRKGTLSNQISLARELLNAAEMEPCFLHFWGTWNLRTSFEPQRVTTNCTTVEHCCAAVPQLYLYTSPTVMTCVHEGSGGRQCLFFATLFRMFSLRDFSFASRCVTCCVETHVHAHTLAVHC